MRHVCVVGVSVHGAGYYPNQKPCAFRYQNKTLSPVQTGTKHALYNVWGADPNNVFVVGGSGTLAKYDGMSWCTRCWR